MLIRSRTLRVAAAAVFAVAVAVPLAPARAEDPSYPVLVGAGDISTCSSYGDKATAELLENIEGEIFSTGDSNQGSGSLDEYEWCFEETWGRFKERMHPVPGNHDYMVRGAEGYFDYFGDAAGPHGLGYYTYELGDWQVIALNSICDKFAGCDEEVAWLRQVLADSTKECTIAYWHYPYFTSGPNYGPSYELKPFVDALYEAGAEIIMSGHNHVYERFGPQNPSFMPDEEYGLRQFVVGTGGASHYSFGYKHPASEAHNDSTFGVLKLTLKPGAYDFQFIPQEGKTFTDEGSGTCHGKPPAGTRPPIGG